MYHDSDNNAVSEPGRFDVETACGTAAIDIGIGRLQNIEWYEARPYRTQSHAIPDIRYEYSNIIIGRLIANIISYTVYTYIYKILLLEWH